MAFLPLVGALLMLGAASMRWTRATMAANLAYLVVPFAPTFALPHLPMAARSAMLGLLALGAAWNFARMTGMATQTRYHLTALASIVAIFLAAHLGTERIFSLTPVAALVGIAAVGVVEEGPDGFLQKLALSWVSVLVYGWMWAHAVLLARAELPGMTSPAPLMAAVILAMGGSVAWSAIERLWTRFVGGAEGPGWLHLVSTTLGGTAAGAALVATPFPHPVLTGACVGFALGAAGRAYVYTVRDIDGPSGEAARERKKKGAVLFGFAFSCAMAALLLLG